MKKSKLQLETLSVESFATAKGSPVTRIGTNGCVCDMAPCGCTKGPDCTSGQSA